MKQAQILIREGEYLSSSLSELPSDSLIMKPIGVGATTVECLSKRHSLIIVPNVPVIMSKTKKHAGILGVYHQTRTADVRNYINSQIAKGEYMKLMVTPESFQKVRKACQYLGIDMYGVFFCLDDEAHQLVKDCDYRRTITFPMDGDFFRFKKKALVTATPIEFTDPRVESFNKIEIRYKASKPKPIDVIHTRGLAHTLAEVLSSKERVFIFVNSIDLPIALLENLGLLKDTHVFCSYNGMQKLKVDYNFAQASDSWNAESMARINVFTARFFTAFDLIIDEKPDVIMLTDSVSSPQTLIDPETDAIQILGRMRNGVNSFTHIFTTNSEIEVKDREACMKEIEAHERTYRTVRTLYEDATDDVSRKVFCETLESLKYHDFVNEDGTKNHFAIDNEVHHTLVRNLYHDADSLFAKYKSMEYFDVHCYEDDEAQALTFTSPKRKCIYALEQRKNTIEVIQAIGTPIGSFETHLLDKLRRHDPLAYEACQVLTPEQIEATGYKKRELERAIILSKQNATKVINLVKHDFTIGYKYTNEEIVMRLTQIYAECGIHKDKAIQAKMINQYFTVYPCSLRIKGKSTPVRGYKIISEAI